jgi:hypothetical protein
VVAVLAIGTHTPPKPHIAPRRTPPYVDFSVGAGVGVSGGGGEHGCRACSGCSTRSKACYSSVVTRKNEAQMLRRFVSIDENPNPSMTPAE